MYKNVVISNGGCNIDVIFYEVEKTVGEVCIRLGPTYCKVIVLTEEFEPFTMMRNYDYQPISKHINELYSKAQDYLFAVTKKDVKNCELKEVISCDPDE